MRKNISMDIMMKGLDENDETIMNEFEPRQDDFMEDEVSKMKGFMKSVSDKYEKKGVVQTTLDSFFIKGGSITLEDAEIRIQTLECENAVLKTELQEIKDKMNRLESLFYHSPPMIHSLHEEISIDPVSQNVLYDRLSTKVRDMERDISNMKITVESFDATQTDHEDRIEWLESHYEDEDSRVSLEDEIPDLGF
jgi:cell division protein FtsB